MLGVFPLFSCPFLSSLEIIVRLMKSFFEHGKILNQIQYYTQYHHHLCRYKCIDTHTYINISSKYAVALLNIGRGKHGKRRIFSKVLTDEFACKRYKLNKKKKRITIARVSDT